MLATLDYHIHSYYSYDSLNKPIEILKTANLKGINSVSVTDHNSLKGSLEISKIKEFENIIRIKGIEIKSRTGDIIVLGLQEEINSKELIEILDICKSNDYVSILPHPFRYFSHKVQFKKEIIQKVDLIEVYNARNTKRANLSALELTKIFYKSYTGGSDAHLINEIGNALTYVEVEDLNENNIIKALKKGKCYGRIIKYSSIFNRLASIAIQSIKRI
jgi:Predicted metal-dependent phosphoesterases (PHP family)